jgi:hypothetical protein
VKSWWVSGPPSVNEALWHQHIISLTISVNESITDKSTSAHQFLAHPRHHPGRLPSKTVQKLSQSMDEAVRDPG